jgi:hypothetical protein
VADLRGARDEPARQGFLWWAAAASLELGEHDEAARLFAQALKKAAAPQGDELRRWGRTNGLAP